VVVVVVLLRSRSVDVAREVEVEGTAVGARQPFVEKSTESGSGAV
jgi:hypothetical protein